ncbi:MAG: methyltransferase dimerization domain-containing protein [Methanosarcinaceae archaeon]|nr:methyltransferase dimerization domain-containing protein [Methanosarcinaceae archaeon]MDD4749740.1 methyltransferase dimerization domain-containing protein [Methanosarcinaceae archaeon]
MKKLARATSCLHEKDGFIEEIAAESEKEQIFQAAADLELFSKLIQAKSAAELAKELGTDPELTARFLDVLVSLEALVKKEGLYFTAPLLASFLGGKGIFPLRRFSNPSDLAEEEVSEPQ